MNVDGLISPSVPLVNIAPPRFAVFRMNVPPILTIEPSCQLIAPPSSIAVLFSKYESVIVTDIYSS